MEIKTTGLDILFVIPDPLYPLLWPRRLAFTDYINQAPRPSASACAKGTNNAKMERRGREKLVYFPPALSLSGHVKNREVVGDCNFPQYTL